MLHLVAKGFKDYDIHISIVSRLKFGPSLQSLIILILAQVSEKGVPLYKIPE